MKDLKLTVSLVNKLSGEFKKVADDIRKQAETANTQAQAQAQKTADVAIREADRLARQRIQIQRASISVEDRLQKERDRERARAESKANAQSIQTLRTQQEVSARLQRQASLAEASLVVDRFDRRIAVERVKHTQILSGLKQNHAAMEAETRRYNAVVGRIEMDKANFSNTPFQKMLQNFEKLNGKLGQMGPIFSTVQTGMSQAAGAGGTMAKTMGDAQHAVGGLGAAMAGFSMGPLGYAISGLALLNAGLVKVNENAARAAEMKAGQAEVFKDQARLKDMIALLERFDKAAAGRAGASQRADANKAFRSQYGESVDEYRGRGAPDPKRQLEALNKVLEHRKKFNDDYLGLVQELETARAQAIPDETQRLLKIEELGYQERKRALGTNKSALEQLEALHADKVASIRREAAKADLEFNAQAATEFQSQQLAIENEKIRRIRDASAKERQEAISRDERRTEQIYGDRGRLEDAEAEGDPLKQLEIRQRREMELVTTHQGDITATEKRHKLERQRADKQYAQTKIQQDQLVAQNYMNALSQIGGAIGAFGGKSKEALIIQQLLALTQIGVNTTNAAIAALAPPPLGLGPVAGAPLATSIGIGGAAAAAAVIAQTAQGMKGFATGTDFAPGGYAWVGERGPELAELPRGTKIHTAGESSRMAAGGFGGDTYHMGGVHITVQGGADSATVERLGAVTNRELRGIVRKIEMAQDRRMFRRGR